MAILYGEIDKDTKREKIHYNRGDMVASQTINDIQDTAIDAHNMATEALDKADSVFQGNGTVVSVGGVQVGTLAFTSDPQQQLDTLNAKITTSSSFNAEIVDQLPTENISTSTFYLIKNSTSADDNTYSEYLYVNGKWELLGNTQVQAYDDSELRELINGLSTTKANKTDLANYYTKDQTYNITEVDAKVINLVSTSYLKSELNPIKTDVNTNKTNIATLQTDIVGKADKADLNNYTKTSDLARVATSNDYNDLDNTPNTDLMVDIINEHSDSINEINTTLANKADKSEIPSISGLASETYVNTQVNTLQGKIDAKVNKTTTINSKPLSSNITLSASDVGALPSDTELFSGNYNDLSNKPTIPTTASQVGALPNTTKYGASLSLTMNTSTYVVTAQLKDQAGNNLGTAQTIDLPLESVVVSGSYDATNKKVILTLKDGSTIDFSVADLIDGLASQSDLDTTNANVLANTTAIGNKLDKVENSTTPQVYGVDALGSQTMYEFGNTVRNGGLVSRFGEQILVPTTPTQDQSATSKYYVDKVDGEIYGHINSEIERVEGLIANAGGTVVTVGSTPVTSLKFDSNPQTQITNLETNLYNTKVILESNVSTNASDIDKLETSVTNLQNDKADRTEIPTDYVTTDTEQTITSDKYFNSAIYFNNINTGSTATYKSNMYQYNDGLDISRMNATDGSDFASIAHFDLINKTLTVGGKTMATVADTQKQATSLRTSSAISMAYGNTAHAMKQITLHNLYGSSSSVFTIENGMLKYNGSAKRGLISLHSVVQFPSASYRDVQVNILRHNTDGTTTGIVTARHAVSSGFTTFSTAPHYVQLASGQKYELRFASGATGYTATFPAWQSYITIQELY